MMKRRNFTTLAAAGTLSAPVFLTNAQGNAPKMTVGVIGHSGRGNFGHGLDKVWLAPGDWEIIAVADADPGGLKSAKKRLKTDAGFADYREMLETKRPDIVAVCPRQPDQHADMILAAIAAGAKGIYVEKPFVRTLEEVDAIKTAAGKTGTKIAVAHRNRYHPDLKAIDQILQNEGKWKIGKLLEIRGRGKGDRRGGSEDLWVLGTHVLDLVTYFAGNPITCSAELRQDGELVTAEHIKPGNEALGPLAGNEVHARFHMENGITAYWDSIANDETRGKGFGLQLIGSDGIVIIHCDGNPLAHYRAGNPFDPGNKAGWEAIKQAPNEETAKVRNHITPCVDLVASIRNPEKEPICGLKEGALTIEMVMAVFASHMSGGEPVGIPLEKRSHPLAG